MGVERKHSHARPFKRRRIIVLAVVLVLVGGVTAIAVRAGSASSAHGRKSAVSSSTTTTRATVPKSAHSTSPASTPTSETTNPHNPAASAGAPSALPLAGKVVGIDPGHNGGNFSNTSFLHQIIWNGRASEDCDTAGTETNGGYTEATYNFNVAQLLKADLVAAGAEVVMTRDSNTGLGPCVDQRAKILNAASPAVSIDIHADGGSASGRGFAILEPVDDGTNSAVVAPSQVFGAVLIQAFLGTGMPISTYDGTNGVAFRSDLAGLNLTTEPKVLIECGNMRNATDAALLSSPTFQAAAATAMTAAIVAFVHSEHP